MFKKAAATNQGFYRHRPTQGSSGGFLGYFGRRRKNVMKQNSPLEGPGQHHLYQFNVHTNNALYMPYATKALNALNEITSHSARFFYKHLHVTNSIPKTHLWINTLSLITFDFCCCSHADMFDQHPDEVSRLMVDLDGVIEDESMPYHLRRQAGFSSYFVSETNSAHPTMCCYQRVEHAEFPLDHIKEYHYFPMDGIASCLRIMNNMTNSFCGSVFQHNTSMPIFLEEHDDDTVTFYLGTHPQITMVGWGGSDNSGNAAPANAAGGGLPVEGSGDADDEGNEYSDGFEDADDADIFEGGARTPSPSQGSEDSSESPGRTIGSPNRPLPVRTRDQYEMSNMATRGDFRSRFDLFV